MIDAEIWKGIGNQLGGPQPSPSPPHSMCRGKYFWSRAPEELWEQSPISIEIGKACIFVIAWFLGMCTLSWCRTTWHPYNSTKHLACLWLQANAVSFCHSTPLTFIKGLTKVAWNVTMTQSQGIFISRQISYSFDACQIYVKGDVKRLVYLWHLVYHWPLSKKGVCWPVSHYHVLGSDVDLIEVMCSLKLTAEQRMVFYTRLKAQVS